MTKQNATKILIVEDELIVALNLSKELAHHGFMVVGMSSTEDEAVSLATSEKPDIILMDINLEAGGSGLVASERIRQHQKIPIVYVTAYSSDKIIDLVGRTNPYGYILKPYNIREVKAVINTALVRFKYEAKIQKSEQRLRVALEAAELGVFEYNRENHQISIDEYSDCFVALGFSKTMEKADFLALFNEKDALEIDALLSAGLLFNKRAKIKAAGNKVAHYVDVYLSHVFYDGGKVQVGAVQDVSEQQYNIEHLKVSDSVLNQMQESVLILDENELIQQVNPSFCKMIGLSNSQLINRSIADFLLQEREDDLSVSATLEFDSEHKGQRKVNIKRPDGSNVSALMTISDLDISEEEKQYVITLTDVSELVAAQKNLSRIAYTDSLTGFGNRAYLNRLLEQLFADKQTQSIALFFIDIDSFKNINDTLGHEAGDHVLAEFSRRLQGIIRDKDFLVRLGGDEFVVILTGHFNKLSLTLVAHKIIQLFDQDFALEDQHVSVSSSIGIAFDDFQYSDPKALLKHADVAMYQAKKKGKNTFEFFDEAMAKETQYRIFIEQGLKAALANNEITIYLQPVVDESGTIKSAEALCRWYDKEAGFIPPDEFIPVAEESYLIQSLGLRVLQESMLAKKHLNEAGFTDISININISEKQLHNPETAKMIQEFLVYYELKANDFVLELTESTLHSAASDKTIAILLDAGFKFALDDFGTGFSSLSRLYDHRVKIIKIDKTFTQLICENSRQNIITRSIINLAKDLGYEIIAEGVETTSQEQALKVMGCTAMQGYLFAKPMPIAEFLRLLRTKTHI